MVVGTVVEFISRGRLVDCPPERVLPDCTDRRPSICGACSVNGSPVVCLTNGGSILLANVLPPFVRQGRSNHGDIDIVATQTLPLHDYTSLLKCLYCSGIHM